MHRVIFRNWLVQTAGGRLSATLAALGIIALTGCDRNEVKVYSVPPEAPRALPDSTAHGDVHGHPMRAPGSAKLHWQKPPGWEEGRTSAMRLASFHIHGPEGQSAEVAVIAMPPSGSETDIVNLWRGQVRLAPASPGEIRQLGAPVTVGDATGKLFDLTSETALIEGHHKLRIVVAMLERDGLSWFFKMTGPEALVAAQRPVFLEFLRTVAFDSAAETASAAPAAPPAQGSAPGGPEWSAPAHWQAVPPAQFLLAQFRVTNAAGARADINISTSPGEGGGLLANVNRWRNQLSLSPWSSDELNQHATTLEAAAGRATVVDFAGTDARSGQPARLVGAMLPHGGQSWFFKLMGDESVVDAEKAAFLNFLRTARLTHAP